MHFRLLLSAVAASTFLLHTHAQKDWAKKEVDSLCQPGFYGRGYVNKGDQKAADYIARRFKELGLSPLEGQSGYTVPFTHDVNTFPTDLKLSILGEDFTQGVDFLPDPRCGAFSDTTLVLVADLDDETWLDIDPDELRYVPYKPIYALVDTSGKRTRQVYEWTAKLAQHVSVIRVTPHKLMWGVGDEQLPNAVIDMTLDAWNRIADSEEDLLTYLHVQPELKRNYTSENVIGVLPGKKKEMLVVCGHYDHLGCIGENTCFHGANDNASGTAMVMNIAKDFLECGTPEYTMVFIAFAGEEAGLKGSVALAKQQLLDPSNIRFVLNLDIMGGCEKGFTVVNAPAHPKEFKSLQKLNKKGPQLEKIKSRSNTQNSDHYVFTLQGVPAFFCYAEGDVKNYHDVNDTPDGITLANYDGVLGIFEAFLGKL